NRRRETHAPRYDGGRAFRELILFSHRRKATTYNGTLSSKSRNASSSVSSSATFVIGFPAPCPALVSTRRRIGLDASPCASCIRAAIFRACIGSTRESLSAVVKSIAGYFVPSTTWW